MMSSRRTRYWGRAVFLLTALLAISTAQAQFRAGDTWGVVRGDNSPGFAYSTFVETPSGRWLAAGPGGDLMLSDNQGADWRYDGRPKGSGL